MFTTSNDNDNQGTKNSDPIYGKEGVRRDRR